MARAPRTTPTAGAVLRRRGSGRSDRGLRDLDAADSGRGTAAAAAMRGDLRILTRVGSPVSEPTSSMSRPSTPESSTSSMSPFSQSKSMVRSPACDVLVFCSVDAHGRRRSRGRAGTCITRRGQPGRLRSPLRRVARTPGSVSTISSSTNCGSSMASTTPITVEALALHVLLQILELVLPDLIFRHRHLLEGFHVHEGGAVGRPCSCTARAGVPAEPP